LQRHQKIPDASTALREATTADILEQRFRLLVVCRVHREMRKRVRPGTDHQPTRPLDLLELVHDLRVLLQRQFHRGLERKITRDLPLHRTAEQHDLLAFHKRE
jgi:hypothetical protein